ncbi:MAG: nucleotidyltransferase family protein [Candidatus Latescibacteria bacterium]|nr:nucleotidyltransferase family protein [Candidatus Latescibacterota bacterium]
MDKAVIMAAGLGTRMQQQNGDGSIDSHQARVADTGIKALIPIDRPFLDYVMSALADAGYQEICLVVGPKHQALRDHYRDLETKRVTIHFAEQKEPRGTADAVASAESFANGDPFVVINSDNYYPAEALKLLRNMDSCGTVAFDREGLLQGNIPAERIARYAILDIDDHRHLQGIVEKPDPAWVGTLPEPICVSMNCWRFDKDIFVACRNIKPSVRGELEMADAVQYLIDKRDKSFYVETVSLPVLDMTSRLDIVSVTKHLSEISASL